MDTGMAHTHKLVVVLYLLQLLVRVVLMATKSGSLEKYTKAMRIPHIVLASLMLVTGIYLMVKAPLGMEPFVFVKVALVLASIPLGVIGGKRGSVALTGLAFLLLVGAGALALTKPAALRSGGTGSESATTSPTAAAGKPLYEQYCMLCHGADGAAGFQGAKNLVASTLPDADIVNIIRNGKGVMPPNAELTDEQVGQVKDYVKSLRK